MKNCSICRVLNINGSYPNCNWSEFISCKDRIKARQLTKEKDNKIIVLRKLEQALLKQPHLRVGQLIVNVLKSDDKDVVMPKLFYLKDNKLVRLIEEWSNISEENK
jgi:hypothetical protein